MHCCMHHAQFSCHDTIILLLAWQDDVAVIGDADDDHATSSGTSPATREPQKDEGVEENPPEEEKEDETKNETDQPTEKDEGVEENPPEEKEDEKTSETDHTKKKEGRRSGRKST